MLKTKFGGPGQFASRRPCADAGLAPQKERHAAAEESNGHRPAQTQAHRRRSYPVPLSLWEVRLRHRPVRARQDRVPVGDGGGVGDFGRYGSRCFRFRVKAGGDPTPQSGLAAGIPMVRGGSASPVEMGRYSWKAGHCCHAWEVRHFSC